MFAAVSKITGPRNVGHINLPSIYEVLCIQSGQSFQEGWKLTKQRWRSYAMSQWLKSVMMSVVLWNLPFKPRSMKICRKVFNRSYSIQHIEQNDWVMKCRSRWPTSTVRSTDISGHLAESLDHEIKCATMINKYFEVGSDVALNIFHKPRAR